MIIGMFIGAGFGYGVGAILATSANSDDSKENNI